LKFTAQALWITVVRFWVICLYVEGERPRSGFARFEGRAMIFWRARRGRVWRRWRERREVRIRVCAIKGEEARTRQ
jgi:hypothetical protein